MYNLVRLRILFELKHRGTLSEVAEALSYSSSAVSQHLSALAAEVGVPLLEPVGRRVRLTPQGEILARHAEIVLQQMELAQSEIVDSLTEFRGHVRVAAFQTAFLGLVPQLVSDLNASHPGLEVTVVHVQPDHGLRSLNAHKCDLVIGEEYPGLPHPGSKAVDRRNLVSDRMRLLLGPAWAPTGSSSVAWSDLSDAPWVLEPPGNQARTWADRVCRLAGFEPKVAFESEDLLVHIKLAETGHAVAILPDLVWRALEPPAMLVDLPGNPSRTLFTAVRLGAAEHPATRLIRQRLAEIAATTQGLGPDGANPTGLDSEAPSSA
jgi:DNA-binding transcriptional LysR family regulator